MRFGARAENVNTRVHLHAITFEPFARIAVASRMHRRVPGPVPKRLEFFCIRKWSNNTSQERLDKEKGIAR
jgi:hypothetical protein